MGYPFLTDDVADDILLIDPDYAKPIKRKHGGGRVLGKKYGNRFTSKKRKGDPMINGSGPRAKYPESMGGKFNQEYCNHVKLEETPELNEQVESMKMVARNYPEHLLNFYVFIYWDLDGVWYRAKVIKLLEQGRKQKLLYDDKKEEKTELADERFLLEDDRLKELAAIRRREFKIMEK